MNETEVHAAVRGLYEGILDPAAWQRSLATVVGMAGGAHGSMAVWDTVRDQVSVSETVNPLPELLAAYEAEFQAIDPAKDFARSMVPGEWYVDARDYGLAAMARHPFYAEFLLRHDILSYAACLVERHPRYDVYFSMQRETSQQPFAPEDTARLAWFIPHIRSAMSLRDRTLGLTALAQAGGRLIDRLGFAVIVMTAERRVLLANRAGETWVRRLDPSAKVSDWTLARPFAAMVRAACDGRASIAGQATLAVDGQGRAAQVLVLPLPASHAFAADWQQPAALVVVHEPGEAPPLLSRMLRDLYGLTPAECRVAVALAHGQGLPEAAAQLNVRHETARSQLKAVFVKTGVASQAQLVRLLSRLGATLEES